MSEAPASRAAAAAPSWAGGIDVPTGLELREGRRGIVFVAPHGGRRRRPIRRGDSVNDLHTAGIAWELAERLDAHAIVNRGLDRNDVDLNRISQIAAQAPQVLDLLAAAVDAAAASAATGGGVPLVLFVHGWNMVVPCCDIGVGLRRRRGRLGGRFPVLSRHRFDTTIAAIERELAGRGVHTAIGRRYTASGRDNATQLFSGRHAGHEHDVVAALGRRAAAGLVDAAQLELGIPLRWPGPLRESFVDGLVAALDRDEPPAPSVGGDHAGDADIVAVPRASCGWRLPPPHAADREDPEPGFALQAVLDGEGRFATFCGVEATGSQSMAARFSVVCTDGSMMLLVGEGEWGGEDGCYDLEGFRWRATDGGRRVELRVAAPMIRYPRHDAYLDLESGLADSRLVQADVELRYEAASADHGRLRGSLRIDGRSLDVDTVAFCDRGGRSRMPGAGRLRVACVPPGGEALVVRSTEGEGESLAMHDDGVLVPAPGASAAAPLEGAEVTAKVPVWRPLGDGVLARWTFGILRCRYAGGATGPGLFESLEVFRRPAQGVHQPQAGVHEKENRGR